MYVEFCRRIFSASSERLVSASNSVSPSRVAHLKKIKLSQSHDSRRVLGVDVIKSQLRSSVLASHLSVDVMDESILQEALLSVERPGDVSALQVREFDTCVRHLQARVENLRAHNELLQLTLTEARDANERLTSLLGQYESNCVALQLAAVTREQLSEAQDALQLLLDSQHSILLAKLRSVGLASASE